MRQPQRVRGREGCVCHGYVVGPPSTRLSDLAPSPCGNCCAGTEYEAIITEWAAKHDAAVRERDELADSLARTQAEAQGASRERETLALALLQAERDVRAWGVEGGWKGVGWSGGGRGGVEGEFVCGGLSNTQLGHSSSGLPLECVGSDAVCCSCGCFCCHAPACGELEAVICRRRPTIGKLAFPAFLCAHPPLQPLESWDCSSHCVFLMSMVMQTRVQQLEHELADYRAEALSRSSVGAAVVAGNLAKQVGAVLTPHGGA
jgi:hypothetical protein